jgi:hypothetical protein
VDAGLAKNLLKVKKPNGGDKKVSKYYVKWTMNPLEIPKNPEERMKAWQLATQMVRDGMKSGSVKDWGMTTDLSKGYAIVEGANETDVAAYLGMWIPILNVVAKPVLTVDQTTETLQKMMTSMASMKR